MRRVAVTGPESTGKSWLSEQLARHYDTAWVPEFARTYLMSLGRPYQYRDILTIARGQHNSEEGMLRSSRSSAALLICDTDFIVLRIWCEVKYGKCHPWILDMAEKHTYDLYLLCDIDLPWQYDPLREHPEMRKELFQMYLNLMENYRFSYSVISGTGEERLKNAVAAIESAGLL